MASWNKQSTSNNMQTCYTIYVILIVVVSLVCCIENHEGQRSPKLLSSFQIVSFPNDACDGTGTRNGTCYTSQECSDRGGQSAGSCADGFGVCCTFVITACGSTTKENNTAWTQPTPVIAGACGLTVCPIDEDICSIRLDFTIFTITGPSTISIVQARRRFGQPVGALLDAYVLQGSTFTTNCLTDVFHAQGASPSTNPPSICGNNAGQHMYVEADVGRCNKLQFNLGDLASVVGSSTDRGEGGLATRVWDITVTQIACSSLLLPPTGCTKYFFNALGRSELRSYNFALADGSTHLANQHERMCIRKERGNCIGCFATVPANVEISGQVGQQATFTQAGGCCGYHTMVSTGPAGLTVGNAANAGDGAAASTLLGFDCIVIPGAYVPAGAANAAPIAVQTTAVLQQVLQNAPTNNVYPAPAGPQFCGNGAGLGIGAANINTAATGAAVTAANAMTNVSICTRTSPFRLEFISDDLEGMGGTGGISEFSSATQAVNRGFTLTHTQIACAAAAAG